MTWLTSIKWSKIGKVTSPSTGSIVLLIALLAAYSIYHWIMLSVEAAPPGSDGGNWLAFSLELFGDNVKAADAVYPPVFPALLRGALLFLPPLTALKVLALITAVCVSIPVYLLLRTAINPWLAALLAAAVPTIDFHNHIFAWGGYPQLLGVVFLLLSIYWLLQGLYTGKIRFFAASALCTVLTVATHALVALQLLLALGVLLAIYFYNRRRDPTPLPRSRLTRMLLFWAAATGLLMLAVVPFYVKTFATLVGSPFNPNQWDLLKALIAAFGSAGERYMWLTIAVVGGAFTVWVVLTRRNLLLAQAVAAICVSSILVFVLLWETRLIYLVQVGVVLSVGVVVTLVNKETFSWLTRLGRRTIRFLVIAFVVAVISGISLFGAQRTQEGLDYYRVVDSQVLEALDWLQEHGSPGDRVVANEAPRGQILGWWVEGYARLPTYSTVDPRWLLFRDEKSQAEIANRFLSADAEPEELRHLAETHHIQFLFLHRGTLRYHPLPDLSKAGFDISFVNESMLILTYGEAEPLR